MDAVERAGGRPVLIPPSEDGVEETLELLDGIVFSGGADVDPALYGAEAHPETDEPQARRDRGELALLQAALEHDVPMLAVCRGVQLLNVARGGDLVQHLPETIGNDVHKQTPGTFVEHPVEVKEGTRLASMVGTPPGGDLASPPGARARSATASSRPRGPRTGRSRASRTRRSASRSASSGTRRPGDDDALFANLVAEAKAYRAERDGR